MTTYAERTSGAVPLLGKDTAPSRHQQTHLPVPTTPVSRREGGAAIEDDVTPLRPPSARERATDLMKATVPLPYLVTIVSIAIVAAAALWRIDSKVDLINERINHNRELNELREKGMEDRFRMLEAKIEAAGLRNFNMSILADQQKARDAQKAR